MKRTFLILALVACSACKEPPPETPRVVEEKGSETKPVAVEEVVQETEKPATPDGPGPYDCEKDEDCGRTCGGGAMNIQWFLANKDKVPDCKDGCAGKGAGEAICVDGGCVATDRDGNVDEYCTRRLEKKD
jgi:hypothetical protein